MQAFCWPAVANCAWLAAQAQQAHRPWRGSWACVATAGSVHLFAAACARTPLPAGPPCWRVGCSSPGRQAPLRKTAAPALLLPRLAQAPLSTTAAPTSPHSPPPVLQLRSEVGVLSVTGFVPEGRAYHTWTCVGSRCLALGGRHGKEPLHGPQLVGVFDVPSLRWLPPGALG